MNGSSQSRFSKVKAATILLVVALLGGFIVYLRVAHRIALEEVRDEKAKVQAQLDEQHLIVSQLRAEVSNLRTIVGAPGRTQTRPRQPAPSDRESELRRQISALQASHSNAVAAAAQNIAAETLRSAAEEQSRSAAAAALAELESSASDALEQAEAARQRAEELMVTLDVPADVAAMDPDAGLQSSNLRAYWPYFEARRERENLQRTADTLRLRLVQEAADSDVDAARAEGP